MNKNSGRQNLLLLAASFVFYALWDWRFLVLLLVGKSVDFISTTQMDKSIEPGEKKKYLYLSIVVNVGILCFFKYFNFFVENISGPLSSLNIVMPIGLSFYTLQALGYVFDVYREEVKPTHNIVEYFAFLSFFPIILAGPIERASNLLYQLKTKRIFDYPIAIDGLRQILWGLFKKVVIADNCAYYANLIFNNQEKYSGSTLLLGALFFTFQIYGDFSGYSDMAIGIAKLFNIRLMRNFAFPYFSRNINEFWQRWHISLSNWLLDYIFKPLQISLRNYKVLVNILALFLTFIISGIWHGADWTFVIWGILNAIYFLPSFFSKRRYRNSEIVARGRLWPSFKETIQMGFTFLVTVFAFIFFRANSLGHALNFISGILSGSLFSKPEIIPKTIIILLGIFILTEWFGREQDYAFAKLGANWYKPFRWGMYYFLLLGIYYFGGNNQQFIYFRF